MRFALLFFSLSASCLSSCEVERGADSPFDALWSAAAKDALLGTVVACGVPVAAACCGLTAKGAKEIDFGTGGMLGGMLLLLPSAA